MNESFPRALSNPYFYENKLQKPEGHVFEFKEEDFRNDLYLTLKIDTKLLCNAFLGELKFKHHWFEIRSHLLRKKEIKAWMRVLMIMSDMNVDQAFTYAQTAFKLAENIPTIKYKYATACRFAIKSYETNNTKEFDQVVQNMLEMMSKSHNFCASLFHCTNALFFIQQKTGQCFKEAIECCLKASLFHKACNEQWDKLLSKQLKQIHLQPSFIEQMRTLLTLSIRYGLRYNDTASLCAINCSHNIRSTNRWHQSDKERQEVRNLMNESKLLLSETVSDAWMEVEEFILNSNWTEENFLKILKTCSNSNVKLNVLNRLLSCYNALGSHLPTDCHVGLAFTYIREVHDLMNSELRLEDLGSDLYMYPVAVMFISEHYRKCNDVFMSCTILLEFVNMAANRLLPKLYDNLPSVKATWYHYCIRSMEIVLDTYTDHSLCNVWKTDLEQLTKQKAIIDVNIDQTINYSEEEEWSEEK